MVYCGKPSKGCDYCRHKRLKCDQKRPSCGQCRNAARTCPGYRNQLDLLFRDESSHVQLKYRVATTKTSASYLDTACVNDHTNSDIATSKHSIKLPATDQKTPASGTGHSTLMASQLEILSAQHRPLPSQSQLLIDVATTFFLTRYTPGSHFDYLPLLYESAGSRPVLSHAVQAVALASLSHQTGDSDIMALARKQYSRSLVEMNAALRDSIAQLQDETLASVLLLAHFESLASEDSVDRLDRTCSPTTSLTSPLLSWNRHIQGAAALMKLRPKYWSMATPNSVRLYQHVNEALHYSCIQRRVRPPHDVLAWGLKFGLKRDRADPDRRSMVVVADFAELRACIREGSLSDPMEIIQHAIAIDASAALVARSFSPDLQYDVVVCRTHAEGVYDHKYHVYPSTLALQLYNEIRMTRLALNEIILTHAHKARDAPSPACDRREDASSSLSQAISRATRTTIKMGTEICQSSTLPLQRPGRRLKPLEEIIEGNSDLTESTENPTIASAYLLIWPLFNAARVAELGEPSLREFVIERMHFMGTELKIPQARRAATMLEQGVINEDWLHMVHLF